VGKMEELQQELLLQQQRQKQEQKQEQKQQKQEQTQQQKQQQTELQKQQSKAAGETQEKTVAEMSVVDAVAELLELNGGHASFNDLNGALRGKMSNTALREDVARVCKGSCLSKKWFKTVPDLFEIPVPGEVHLANGWQAALEKRRRMVDAQQTNASSDRASEEFVEVKPGVWKRTESEMGRTEAAQEQPSVTSSEMLAAKKARKKERREMRRRHKAQQLETAMTLLETAMTGTRRKRLASLLSLVTEHLQLHNGVLPLKALNQVEGLGKQIRGRFAAQALALRCQDTTLWQPVITKQGHLGQKFFKMFPLIFRTQGKKAIILAHKWEHCLRELLDEHSKHGLSRASSGATMQIEPFNLFRDKRSSTGFEEPPRKVCKREQSHDDQPSAPAQGDSPELEDDDGQRQNSMGSSQNSMDSDEAEDEPDHPGTETGLGSPGAYVTTAGIGMHRVSNGRCPAESDDHPPKWLKTSEGKYVGGGHQEEVGEHSAWVNGDSRQSSAEEDYAGAEEAEEEEEEEGEVKEEEDEVSVDEEVLDSFFAEAAPDIEPELGNGNEKAETAIRPTARSTSLM